MCPDAVLEVINLTVLEEHNFTQTWFDDTAKKVWTGLLPRLKPSRYLEIGSFEGASACFVIESCNWSNSLEVHCIDTWKGWREHVAASLDMCSVEMRFDHNMKVSKRRASAEVSVFKHKHQSSGALVELLASGKGEYFDFIYVDGSHMACDVLLDAVLSFQLLATGGVLVFDDYLWNDPSDQTQNILNSPKLAIDSFINIYFSKLKVIQAPLYQIFVQKKRA
jgi:predicted O-methyltransferase YrrM